MAERDKSKRRQLTVVTGEKKHKITEPRRRTYILSARAIEVVSASAVRKNVSDNLIVDKILLDHFKGASISLPGDEVSEAEAAA